MQTGDVGAGDEEDEQRGADDEEQTLRQIFTNHLFSSGVAKKSQPL